ncbi:hypothetical protein ACFPRL_02990 [Pseudoclavibacter helvolus]
MKAVVVLEAVAAGGHPRELCVGGGHDLLEFRREHVSLEAHALLVRFLPRQGAGEHAQGLRARKQFFARRELRAEPRHESAEASGQLTEARVRRDLRVVGAPRGGPGL